jgi:hypothetical protein
MPAAFACEIQDRINRESEHRSLDEIAAIAPEHGFGFGVVSKKPAINQRRQILATRGGDFKTVKDRIAHLCAGS